ncbi:MAG: 4-hydroxythreonine-4-phosphate dehydrogenase PdxA [Chloroflexi bacterium]|nr:4-hydroxythreonine-4-phosphate dehydrogenase PdxA [Chloroflexota bacterium]
MDNRPAIALTMGDAAGIGPEITAKAFSRPEVSAACRLLVIGDVGVMRNALKAAGIDVAMHCIKSPSEAVFAEGQMEILDLDNVEADRVPVGKVNPATARAALEAVVTAARLAAAGQVAAMVSAPTNKQAIHMVRDEDAMRESALEWETLDESPRRMVQVGPLRIFGVTPHVSLREAIDMLTVERILDATRLANEALRRMGFAPPRIAVAAINPHAGEGGLFGREEVDIIGPAVEAARAEGIAATGPIPGDTVFVRAKNGEFDGVMAMYHDQTTMPPKLLGFGGGVSVPLDRPYIAVTTAHGTAFDIAGKGIANPQSLVDAILLAAKMAGRRA